MSRVITVLMDLPSENDSHRFTVDALRHAIAALGAPAELRVVPTDAIAALGDLGDGVVVGPGSPYRDPVGAEQAIQTAREERIPIVGTCGGFQHMLIEHARTLLGVLGASHAEYGLGGVEVVSPLSCSLTESQIEISLTPGTLLSAIHEGEPRRVERTNCSYGLAPGFAHIASSAGMAVAAVDDVGEVRAVERNDHPFYLGTLYQPQRTSSRERPHPVWLTFVSAVCG